MLPTNVMHLLDTGPSRKGPWLVCLPGVGAEADRACNVICLSTLHAEEVRLVSH